MLDYARTHDDPYAVDAPPLAVDRRRVIHSSAFRRLQYKTQVFVSRSGDHFRSRMTHTLEVANLARTIATELGLNSELAEIVALAHDLGHPPFGHAGERALDAAAKRHGTRFEHNDHTLRVVTHLEHPYPEFRGLNLTAAVLDCLSTHQTRYDRAGSESHGRVSLESQVVALADQLAYATHDLQDGLYAGLIEPARLMSDADLWRSTFAGPARPALADCLRHLRPTVERMQFEIIRDVSLVFRTALSQAGLNSVADARESDRIVLRPSDSARSQLARLLTLLEESVYRDQTVAQMDADAERVISAVFDVYVRRPELLPERFGERIAREGATRVVLDYVAGMTDGFCKQEHARLCGTATGDRDC